MQLINLIFPVLIFGSTTSILTGGIKIFAIFAACIAALMKMPITAIIFAVEVLGCYENIIYVIIVAAIAYILTEIFDIISINDTVVDDRLEELGEGHKPKVIDTYVTVKHKEPFLHDYQSSKYISRNF